MGVNYYAVNVAGDTLQLSDTVGGSPLQIADPGSGQVFLGEIPDNLVRAVMVAAAFDFLKDEADEKDIIGNTGLPKAAIDLIARPPRI